MKRRWLIPLITALALFSPGPVDSASGQAMRVGTTWSPPEDPDLAEKDLREMKAAGFSIVRLGRLATADLMVLADTLGIDVYQDLPVRAVTSNVLADTLPAARAIISDIAFMTHRHRSLKGVGLVDLLDSSDPAAC
ncbi:MAG: hypothetical protein R3178_05405, partial [Rhodothermales bacterium]|nr:hypothetical protein [Rhodothermales bacterium]